MSNQSKYRDRGWYLPNGDWYEPTKSRMDIGTREDGRVERFCREHGVGHPIGHLTKWENWMGVHGCCGCCRDWDFTGQDMVPPRSSSPGSPL